MTPTLSTPVPAPARGQGRVSGLSVLGELMITVGVLLLCFCAWQLWWTDVAAGRDAGRALSGLESEWAKDPVLPVSRDPLVRGSAFAVMQIPALGDDWAWPVLEGTDHATLQKGLGHFPGTVRPGAIGNMAVAGHRTTYGRPLHDIQRLTPGDAIVVTTRQNQYTYRVRNHVIVRPWQSEAAAANPDHPGEPATVAMLTLTTCHPAYSARERYVVHAVLDSVRPRLG